MLYNLLVPLAGDISFFNLFKYITFRTAGAIMTALFIGLVFGPKVINWLKSIQPEGQPIREDGPKQHLITKIGTPTMGGSLILLSLTLSTLIWADLTNPYIWIILFITLSFGCIGFFDDYTKLKYRSSDGISGKLKLVLQASIAFIAIVMIISLQPNDLATGIAIPFFKNVLINLGYLIIPFAILVIVGSSNAVNLTDGLDGLAIGPAIVAASCFCLISYLVGNIKFAQYLQIHHIQGTGELAIFCGAMIGAGLAFLWYNAPPANVFMGDTGSLSMGGALGGISVITKHEIVLAIVGGLFVIETISVIIQVVSFKLTGKRVFKMAPLHHHFEHKGWSESTIVIRFWIIAGILALIGLTTLKIR